MKKIVFFIYILSITQFIPAQNNIEITYERQSDNSVDFYYSKNIPGSYSIKLEFTTLNNSLDKKIHEKVVKYNSGKLFTISPRDEKNGISFSFKVSYIMGNPNPKVNTSVQYCLPFKKGKNMKIMEASFLGEQYFGSEKPVSWKSFIVFSNESDTICAMRKGKVVKIVDEYEHDALYKKVYTSRRNNITIEHEDGTYASYKGFQKNEIFVELGQDVYPQTSLGKLEKYNDDKYRLDFNIYHFLDNLLDKREKETLKNIKIINKYLNPLFLTEQGLVKIEPGKIYTTMFNDDILLQEFSRREKKKYKKNPKLYLE